MGKISFLPNIVATDLQLSHHNGPALAEELPPRWARLYNIKLVCSSYIASKFLLVLAYITFSCVN